MKKLLLVFALASALVACVKSDKEETVATLTYVVYYPTTTDTVVVTNNAGYKWCNRGGLGIIQDWGDTQPIVYVGTNPFKVLSYIKVPRSVAKQMNDSSNKNLVKIKP
jgi:hypothetical protein